MAVAPENRVPGRPLGRQPRYDLDGDRLHVIRMPSDPLEGPRATERSSIADLARVLDDLDAYAAYAAYVLLGDDGVGIDHAIDGPLPDDLRATSTLPLPYRGVGLAFPEPDEDGLRATMLFFHRAEEVAQTNADALADVLANVRLAEHATPNTLLGQLRHIALVPTDA